MIYKLDPVLVAKLRKSHGSWFNEDNSGCSVGANSGDHELYCQCDKYIDRRHCKIKSDDPMLQYCMDEIYDITVTGAYYDKIASMATSSRRIGLFKFLGLLVTDGWSARFTARALSYRFKVEIYRELVAEGIIV